MTSTDATQIDTSEEEQHPRRQTLCGVLRREGNWKCLLLTLAVVGCIYATAWCLLTTVTREVIDLSMYPIKRTLHLSPCAAGYSYAPAALAALLYLVYLVECYHSTARIQLAKRVDVAAVALRVRAMKDAAPRVWWKAVCYHYVRRKRQVTRYRNGDAYHTTQVYYERVNTHTASASFAHACCGHRDASRRLVLDAGPPAPVTKLRLSKGFAFANIEAASEFEDQRSRFFAEHERYDDFMEMREGLDLVGISSFKEYMVAYRDAENIPWYSSHLFFWVLSSLMLSWPLRIIIECNTAYVHYTITKIFGNNYELESSRQLDLGTQIAGLTPPITASNYNWSHGNIALTAEQRTIMATGAISPTVNSIQNSSGQINILALAARNRSSADPGEMSHATTIDSLELFATIRENCAMIPSYSEALRIDAALRDETPTQDDTHDEVRREETLREDKSLPTAELEDRSQQTSLVWDPEAPLTIETCSANQKHSDADSNIFTSDNVINVRVNKVAELANVPVHAQLCGNVNSDPNICDNKLISNNCSEHKYSTSCAIMRNKSGKKILETVSEDNACTCGGQARGASLTCLQPVASKSSIIQYNICCCQDVRHRAHTIDRERSRVLRREMVLRKEQNRRSWGGFRSNHKNLVNDILPLRTSSRSIPSLHRRRDSSVYPLLYPRHTEGNVGCSCHECIVNNRSNYQAIESEIYEANGISKSIDRNLAAEADLSPDKNLYYSSVLSDCHPNDPFCGKSQTSRSQTEEPPSYEQAIQMPVLRRITRSLTDRGELFGQSRAFITDTIMNRRSCLDSVVSVPEGVRLLQPSATERGLSLKK